MPWVTQETMRVSGRELHLGRGSSDACRALRAIWLRAPLRSAAIEPRLTFALCADSRLTIRVRPRAETHGNAHRAKELERQLLIRLGGDHYELYAWILAQ